MREFLIWVISILCGIGGFMFILMALKQCWKDIFENEDFI
jgi:hypothetical protein